jgi:hypothetical protein
MSLWFLAGSAHGLYAVLLHDGNAGWQLIIARRERGLAVDHTTVFRWVQRFAPELDKRCRPLRHNPQRIFSSNIAVGRAEGSARGPFANVALHRGVWQHGPAQFACLDCAPQRYAAYTPATPITNISADSTPTAIQPAGP